MNEPVYKIVERTRKLALAGYRRYVEAVKANGHLPLDFKEWLRMIFMNNP